MTGRVVEVAGSLAVGGAERVALDLAVGLGERGWDASLLVAGPDAGTDEYKRTLRAEAEARGVAVEVVPFGGLGDRAGRARVRRFLVDNDVRLVHVHNRPQDWQLVTLAALAGIPAIYTVHTPYQHRSLRSRALYRALGRAVPKVVCVSRTVADYIAAVEGVPRSKLQVIYNAINLERFVPPSSEERARTRTQLAWGDGDFIWIIVARLVELKGHAFLLEALKRLPAESRARLVLAGDGPVGPTLRAQVAQLGLEARVSFLGARTDVPALLGAADGYACASRQEGHPLSVLEAMAMTLPVVAPRLPSMEEIAITGAPRFYGPRHDAGPAHHDPAQIAEAMLATERAADERAIGAQARAHVATGYTREQFLGGHEALYREIMARRSLLRLLRSGAR